MEKYKMELTEKEMLIILTMREEEREEEQNKKEKNFFRKYFFNKWTLIDIRVAMVRELMRFIFAYYIIQSIKGS
ncbi:MAG: hypothetical protein ACRCXT_23945 [Paraclostridium sp.]